MADFFDRLCSLYFSPILLKFSLRHSQNLQILLYLLIYKSFKSSEFVSFVLARKFNCFFQCKRVQNCRHKLKVRQTTIKRHGRLYGKSPIEVCSYQTIFSPCQELTSTYEGSIPVLRILYGRKRIKLSSVLFNARNLSY